MTDPAPMPATIVERLWQHAVARPDHPALIFDDGSGPTARLTYAELGQAVSRIAANLLDRGLARRPIALLFAPGLDFVTAFFACLAIGSIAVPLAPMGRRRERIANLLPVIADCAPAALLVDGPMAAQYGGLRDHLALLGVRYLTLDELDGDGDLSQWPGSATAHDLAVLQYTSGSTSSPKGVMISHGNIMANQRMIQRSFGHDTQSDFVGWAPHFHDQGLFGNILQPLYLGSTCVLTAPTTFIRRPLVWLELIDRYRAHTSGGPNFAFDLCVEQARRKGLPNVDLGCWKVAFNGAEPIRAAGVEAFAQTFAPLGFSRNSFFPCYGLAECTIVTACGPRDHEPVMREVSAAAMGEGRVAEPAVNEPALPQVCCGPLMDESELIIVDPATRKMVAPDRTGEIWLAGPHIGHGYWQRPDASRESFGARLADGRGPYLRTGDVGYLTPEGLYVVGRIKDLIILRGRNYAPSDVEQLWSELSGQAGQAVAAAFQLDRDGASHVVLVAEMDRALRPSSGLPLEDGALTRKIRQLAIERLDLSITDLVLVGPGAVPRTTSGKVRRSATRDLLLAGTLSVIDASGPLARNLGPVAQAVT